MKKKPIVYKSVMLPAGFHKELKKLAANSGQTMVDIITESLRALYPKLRLPRS
jgi:hypothetical protein